MNSDNTDGSLRILLNGNNSVSLYPMHQSFVILNVPLILPSTPAHPILLASLNNNNDNKMQNKLDYKCSFCKKIFTRKWAMDRHINGSHLNMRPFGCDKCGKKFKQKHHLKKHIKIHLKTK